MKEIKKWKWVYLLLTLAVMAFGICLMIWPGISAEILCYALGTILLVVGVMRIVCYFQRGISVLWHRYELPLGLLDALAGICFLSHPANVLLILPVVVGIMIIVDSVFHLQTALELRRIGAKRWWVIFAFATVSILVAIGLIRNPFEGSMTLMVYLGISLVIDSVQSLYYIHHVAKDIRRLAPIDTDYVEVE